MAIELADLFPLVDGGTPALPLPTGKCIDLIDAQLLKAAAPETPIQYLAGWADPFKLACAKFGIDGVRPIAALLAQCAHESGGFQRLSENLNYSAQGLADTWPHRFANPDGSPNASALQLAHQPVAIANNVYANRMGNGPPSSGDGWKHRGEGPIQITGKANQQEFADAMGMSLDDVPAYLQTVNGGAMGAAWFFVKHGLIDLAITPGVEDETRAINGGLEGLADRKARFTRVVSALLARGA